jgi:[ribosomal protein S18]-alanine N-acetyltransferase
VTAPRVGSGAGGGTAASGRSARVSLRSATPADAATIAALDASTSTSAWSTATYAAELDHADRRYVVAEAADGTVVGFAGLALLAGEGHVLGLAVDPARRGRGIGTGLLDALLRAAVAAGCDGVTLEVRPSNGPARRLYGRAGFAAAGRRRGYYPDGEDALLLWRRDRDPAVADAGRSGAREVT